MRKTIYNPKLLYDLLLFHLIQYFFNDLQGLVNISLGMGGASPPATIVAPPILFEELELSKIEQELDKLPILKAPASR